MGAALAAFAFYCFQIKVIDSLLIVHDPLLMCLIIIWQSGETAWAFFWRHFLLSGVLSLSLFQSMLNFLIQVFFRINLQIPHNPLLTVKTPLNTSYNSPILYPFL